MNQPYLFPPRNILVPTDMGPVSKSALKYARYFHERFGSNVTVLHAEHLAMQIAAGPLLVVPRSVQ